MKRKRNTETLPQAQRQRIEGDALNELPLEILFEICSYLTPPEVITFKQVSQTFLLTQNIAAFDALLQPLLNKLNSFAPHFSIKPPPGLENTAWRAPLFKNLFNQIAQNQWTEILHFKKCVAANILHLPQEFQQALTQINGPAEKLHTLEALHTLLNRINISIILPTLIISLTANFNGLNLDGKHLTRIPESLFDKADYALFWNNLESLRCNNNHLQFLPKGMGKCIALEYFNCAMNQLQDLPNSIGQCGALRTFACNDNQLHTLPESLGQCNSLEHIFCYNNHLQDVPESCVTLLGKAWKDKMLSCQNISNYDYYLRPVVTWVFNSITSITSLLETVEEKEASQEEMPSSSPTP